MLTDDPKSVARIPRMGQMGFCDALPKSMLELDSKKLAYFETKKIIPSKLQWNPSVKATQDDGLSKEVACHEG